MIVSRPHLAYLLMLGSALAFATMSACARGLKDQCDWRVVAVGRAGLALVITWFIAWAARQPLVWPGPKTLWMRSLVGSCGMLCTFYSLTRLPVSGSVTLLNTYPLWVAVLSWPVLGLLPSSRDWIAVLVGLAGIGLIAASGTHAEVRVDNLPLAVGLGLAGALASAIVMIGLHRLRKVNPLAIAVHFGGISTIACVGYLLLTHRLDRPLDPFVSETQTWLLLMAMGALASLGQILMTVAFQHGLPDRLATIGLSQSVFALGFDLVLWNHPIDVWLIAGMACVLAPGAWLVLHRRRVAEPLGS